MSKESKKFQQHKRHITSIFWKKNMRQASRCMAHQVVAWENVRVKEAFVRIENDEVIIYQMHDFFPM